MTPGWKFHLRAGVGIFGFAALFDTMICVHDFYYDRVGHGIVMGLFSLLFCRFVIGNLEQLKLIREAELRRPPSSTG